MWYKDKVYNMPCLHSFRSRALKYSGSGGSLHSPGLARIDDIDLQSEILTSAAQLGSGKFIISAERTLIFLSTPVGATSAAPQGAFSFEMPVRSAKRSSAKKVGFTF
jgi:hypothetical protein